MEAIVILWRIIQDLVTQIAIIDMRVFVPEVNCVEVKYIWNKLLVKMYSSKSKTKNNFYTLFHEVRKWKKLR